MSNNELKPSYSNIAATAAAARTKTTIPVTTTMTTRIVI